MSAFLESIFVHIHLQNCKGFLLETFWRISASIGLYVLGFMYTKCHKQNGFLYVCYISQYIFRLKSLIARL